MSTERAVLCVLVAWMFGRRAYHNILYALLQNLTGDRVVWPLCLDALLSCAQPGSRLSLSRNSSYRSLLVCRIDAGTGCVWAMPLEASSPKRQPMAHCGIDVYRQGDDRCHRAAVELVRIRLWSAFRARLIKQWVPPVWDANVRATFSHLVVSRMDFPTTEGWYSNEGGSASPLNKHGIVLFASSEVVCLPWALCNQSLKVMRGREAEEEKCDLDGALPYYAEEVVNQAFLPGASLATGDKEGSHIAVVAPPIAVTKKKRRRMTPQERRDADEKKRKTELRDRLQRESRGKSALQEADVQSALAASSVGRQRICIYNSRDAPVRLPCDAPLLWAAVGMYERTERLTHMGSSQVVVMDPAGLCREVQMVDHPALECAESAIRPVCDLYHANPNLSSQEADPKAAPLPEGTPRFRVYYFGKRVYEIDMHYPTLRRYRLRTPEGGAVLVHQLLADRWFLPFGTYEEAEEAANKTQQGHVREVVPCYRWVAYDPNVEPMDVVLESGMVARRGE